MKTLRDRIIDEEGLKLFPYKDTKGIWTIGIGHNMENDPEMMMRLTELQATGITKQYAFDLFDIDVQIAKDALQGALPWTEALDWPRKSVLIDMVFNMGLHKVLQFHNTLECIKGSKFCDASEEMLDSAWAKQVGQRAINLAEIMKTGEGVA